YEPLAGGMAAALPHVDVFVSGHSLHALDDVLAAVRHASAPESAGVSPLGRRVPLGRRFTWVPR
ncbi:MAG TPA: hypothetical protein VLW53_02230, partial [Candidatus Eisenbacteria bacterium]|nr:hypothetical protein [Candidatus Eisenbacteria bacterium]